ncbi:myosin-IIIb-like isoform X2 [Convolutriloba macropyga]|uniref:myosin-IIIb-like isoform X2 n=1 Tax=Convolutriloba macropyga TaxID=536237 RepID=UPI003F51DA04
MENSADLAEEIDTEYSVLAKGNGHPNLPEFYGAFLQSGHGGGGNMSGMPAVTSLSISGAVPKQIWIAIELCEGGTVTDLAKNVTTRGRRIDEMMISYMMRDTTRALSYLHENNIIHRDVKGQNVLITSDGRVKLVDFGVSAHNSSFDRRRNTSVGTPFWMSPEVIACENQRDAWYDNRCDVWSLGITGIELADGDPPLCELHPVKALFRIPRNNPPTLRRPADWSDEFNSFLASCLVKDFEQRAFARDLVSSDQFLQLCTNYAKQSTEGEFQLHQSLVRLILDNAETGEFKSSPAMTMNSGQLRESARKKKNQKLPTFADMALMSELTLESVFGNLKKRYSQDEIYTYIGDVLVAMNPYNHLPIYKEHHRRRYRKCQLSENAPHIFAIADKAHQMMCSKARSQCLVVVGESGAGKTESSNHLMAQLTFLGKAPRFKALESKILQVGPILEAFGNALTMINDNSSRYGKMLQIKFNPSTFQFTGATINEYLLEKTRVTNQNLGERNFHVFYYLFAGVMSRPELQRKYQLDNMYFKYLGVNGALLSASDDEVAVVTIQKNRFLELEDCMKTVGFLETELDDAYAVLAAILHLGELEFVVGDHFDYHETTAIENMDKLTLVCELLGLKEESANISLTREQLETNDEDAVCRHMSPGEAEGARDAMARALYSRLFNWLVARINSLLRADSQDSDLAVGILDIFGFEDLDKNSFEQLCINVTNEQLQYYFNQSIFKAEQMEIEEEKVSGVVEVEFEDNTSLLDSFMAKPFGLFSLLDEESRFPRATEITLIEKFSQHLSSENFWRPRHGERLFGIYHFAGQVAYDAAGFLDKNRDRVGVGVVDLLRESTNPLVNSLFSQPISRTGHFVNVRQSGKPKMKQQPLVKPSTNAHFKKVDTSAMFKTKPVGTNFALSQRANQQSTSASFRYSLMELTQILTSMDAHFIACIKPNNDKVPHRIEKEKVISQLKYAGVVEVCKIRQNGFSYRPTFAEFIEKYKMLLFGATAELESSAGIAKEILEKSLITGYRIGKTKVFLGYSQQERLDHELSRVIKFAVTLQRYARGLIIRRRRRLLNEKRKKSAVIIQKLVRGYLIRRRVLPQLGARKEATLMIQSSWRGYLVRRKYSDANWNVKWGKLAKLKAVIILQTYVRAWRVRALYDKLRCLHSHQENQQLYFVIQTEELFEEYEDKFSKTANVKVPLDQIQPILTPDGQKAELPLQELCVLKYLSECEESSKRGSNLADDVNNQMKECSVVNINYDTAAEYVKSDRYKSPNGALYGFGFHQPISLDDDLANTSVSDVTTGKSTIYGNTKEESVESEKKADDNEDEEDFDNSSVEGEKLLKRPSAGRDSLRVNKERYIDKQKQKRKSSLESGDTLNLNVKLHASMMITESGQAEKIVEDKVSSSVPAKKESNVEVKKSILKRPSSKLTVGTPGIQRSASKPQTSDSK